MIHKINPSVDYNYTQINGQTNQNSVKVRKVGKPTNKNVIINLC